MLQEDLFQKEKVAANVPAIEDYLNEQSPQSYKNNYYGNNA